VYLASFFEEACVAAVPTGVEIWISSVYRTCQAIRVTLPVLSSSIGDRPGRSVKTVISVEVKARAMTLLLALCLIVLLQACLQVNPFRPWLCARARFICKHCSQAVTSWGYNLAQYFERNRTVYNKVHFSLTRDPLPYRLLLLRASVIKVRLTTPRSLQSTTCNAVFTFRYNAKVS